MTLTVRLFIIVICTTQGVNSFSQTNINKSLRFDGFYQTVSEIDAESKDTSYSYLRFYSDGKVISVTSTGTANDVKRWFNLSQDNPSTGFYEIKAARLYFTTTSNEGTVVYDGQISDKYYLNLSVKSLINGNHSQEKYYFIKIVGLK